MSSHNASRRAPPGTVGTVAERGSRRRRRAIGTTEIATRAPVRLIVSVVALLALASVLSFPTIGGAQSAPPAGLRAAVLTPDGTDGYVLDDGTDRVTASTEPANLGGNLRLVFWPGAARLEADETSCATWSDATSDLVQQGAALRITADPGGRVRAITVTKNVFVHTFWMFNIHVWDGRSLLGREIASFDLGSVFRTGGAVPAARPLPWRLCARTRAGRVEFKVWRLEEAEPEWGDPAHGGSTALPADAPASGAAGWFVGHLRPGMSATFSDLHEHPSVAAPAGGLAAPGPRPARPTGA